MRFLKVAYCVSSMMWIGKLLKDSIGIANRGVYMPLGKGEPAWWQDMPDYLRECLVTDGERCFDDLIYLTGRLVRLILG